MHVCVTEGGKYESAPQVDTSSPWPQQTLDVVVGASGEDPVAGRRSPVTATAVDFANVPGT